MIFCFVLFCFFFALSVGFYMSSIMESEVFNMYIICGLICFDSAVRFVVVENYFNILYLLAIFFSFSKFN